MANVSIATPVKSNPVQSSRVIDGILEVWGSVPSLSTANETFTFDVTSGVFSAPPTLNATVQTDGGFIRTANVVSVATTGFVHNFINSTGPTDNPVVHYHAIGPAV